MHVNYYKASQEDIPKSITSLFDRYFLKTPKLISFGIEDATVGIYKFENGLELYDGCGWCEQYNLDVLRKHYDEDSSYYSNFDPTKMNIEGFGAKLKEVFNIDIKNEDDTYKALADVLEEMSLHYKREEYI